MLYRTPVTARTALSVALLAAVASASSVAFAQAAPQQGGAPPPSTPPQDVGATGVTPAAPVATPAAPAEAPPAKTNPEAPLESEPAPVKGKWNPVLYGFVEFDSIRDSTQSLNDFSGNAAIARSGSYAGEHPRTTFGVRNSRLGFKLAAPETAGVRATGILEMDFLGNQPPIGNQPPNASEAAVFTNPAFRIRHFAMKLETEYVDAIIGQYWQLFGWQTYFHPNTVEIQGIPGEVYSRSPQVRLSHTFKTDPVNVEVAVAASRPPQRDSGTPDGQAGVRAMLNDWKGLRTGGATGTSVDALAIGVSGVARHFSVPEFTASPKDNIMKNGWGLSFDAFVPVIPATMESRANALTLTGSFVTGTGISDLYTGLTGGLTLPTLAPNPTNITPPPTYTSGLDNGLATFDANGNLHTIDWQSYIVGIQYYLPPSGKVWLSANYSHMSSDNAKDYVGGTSPLTPATKVFTKSNWVDGNVFWDALPSVRFGLEYAFFQQKYADGNDAKNHRVQFSGFYIF